MLITVLILIPLWRMRTEAPPPPLTPLITLRHTLTLLACLLIAANLLQDPITSPTIPIYLIATITLALSLILLILSPKRRGARPCAPSGYCHLTTDHRRTPCPPS